MQLGMTSELLADSFLKTLFTRFYHTLQLHSPVLHRGLQVIGCTLGQRKQSDILMHPACQKSPCWEHMHTGEVWDHISVKC